MSSKILIVDDEEDVRESLKLLLTELSYDVIEAGDGEEAIKVLKSENHLLSTGLILCDINMPKMSGVECIDFFTTQAPGIPVVVVTGYPDAELAANLMAKGCKGYLVKPVKKDKLLEVCKAAMTTGGVEL